MTAQTMQKVLAAGSDLTLMRAVPQSTLHQLASAARTSGAKLTIVAKYPASILEDVALQYTNTVCFVVGSDDFKKD